LGEAVYATLHICWVQIEHLFFLCFYFAVIGWGGTACLLSSSGLEIKNKSWWIPRRIGLWEKFGRIASFYQKLRGAGIFEVKCYLIHEYG